MRSQITTEFLVLTSIGLFGLVVVIILAASQIKDLYDSREYIITRNKALELQNELYLAAQVHPGYSRSFVLRSELEGIDIKLGLSGNTLVLNSTRYQHVLRVPQGIAGNFQLDARNTIENRGGALYITAS
jgi:hypothetical protein